MIANKHQPNTKKVIRFACLAMFLLLVVFGCSKKEGDKALSKDGKEKSAVVAKVGKSPITVSDFKSYLSNRSMPYRHQISKEDIEKRLDEIVLEEVLYQEALRLKLEQEPEMRERIRQMLSQKLIDEQINRKVWNRKIGEDELQAYYEKHRDEFNRPAQVRLADIFISVPPDATAEQRAELRKKAQTALSEALEVRGKRSGFGTLVRKYSDSHEKYRKGDTGFFDTEGKPGGIDKNLAAEAFKLERVGSMPEGVIETADGYHVVMLIGRRSAVQTPFERVRNQLEQRIRRESVTKARQDYVNGLKAGTKIQIDNRELDKVVAELSKPKPKPESKGKKPMVRSPVRPGMVEKPPPLNR